ncbi:hypothetical protein LLG95_06640 [bacterium]|nr:hypothetical protein [bacterium]
MDLKFAQSLCWCGALLSGSTAIGSMIMFVLNYVQSKPKFFWVGVGLTSITIFAVLAGLLLIEDSPLFLLRGMPDGR